MYLIALEGRGGGGWESNLLQALIILLKEAQPHYEYGRV